jgi:hypothetical protein
VWLLVNSAPPETNLACSEFGWFAMYQGEVGLVHTVDRDQQNMLDLAAAVGGCARHRDDDGPPDRNSGDSRGCDLPAHMH